MSEPSERAREHLRPRGLLARRAAADRAARGPREPGRDTLSAITEQAAAELSSWADELSESELEALRDPRNWVRPVAAVAVGGARRRRARRWSRCAAAAGPHGLRATAETPLRVRGLAPDG